MIDQDEKQHWFNWYRKKLKLTNVFFFHFIYHKNYSCVLVFVCVRLYSLHIKWNENNVALKYVESRIEDVSCDRVERVKIINLLHWRVCWSFLNEFGIWRLGSNETKDFLLKGRKFRFFSRHFRWIDQTDQLRILQHNTSFTLQLLVFFMYNLSTYKYI